MVVCAAAVDVSSVVVVVIVHSSKDGLAKLRCKSHSKTRLIRTSLKTFERTGSKICTVLRGYQKDKKTSLEKSRAEQQQRVEKSKMSW